MKDRDIWGGGDDYRREGGGRERYRRWGEGYRREGGGGREEVYRKRGGEGYRRIGDVYKRRLREGGYRIRRL